MRKRTPALGNHFSLCSANTRSLRSAASMTEATGLKTRYRCRWPTITLLMPDAVSNRGDEQRRSRSTAAKNPLHAVKDPKSTKQIPHHQNPLHYRKCSGGADRSRTDDLLRAKQALSQLSYGPAIRSPDSKCRTFGPTQPRLKTNAAQLVSRVVGLGRVELPTSRLSGVRSNHLSYRPVSGCQMPDA